MSVAGVQGASAGERTFADELDQRAQPPAGERHVMGREEQVQAVFRGVALVLAFRERVVKGISPEWRLDRV